MSEGNGPRPRTAVIIPALNEAACIGYVVGQIPWMLVDECIVVDNGSTDGTAEAAIHAGARVVHQPLQGYGRAIRTGIAAAHPDTEIFICMDGDGSDVPSQLPRLLNPILAGEADFVIGSRMRGTRARGGMNAGQIFACWFAGAMLHTLYRVRYTDMGPFRAITRQALDRLDMKEETYGWNLEMQMRAAQQKLRILEVPTDCRARYGGESKVSGSLKGAARAAVRITQTLLRVASQR